MRNRLNKVPGHRPEQQPRRSETAPELSRYRGDIDDGCHDTDGSVYKDVEQWMLIGVRPVYLRSRHFAGDIQRTVHRIGVAGKDSLVFVVRARSECGVLVDIGVMVIRPTPDLR